MQKLAIVGSGKPSREDAPWSDPSYDIWVFNEAANTDNSKWVKRWDAVFQMHSPELYKAHNTKDPKHWEWLQQKHGKPVIMQEVDSLVPDSVRYPLEDAIALNGHKYLTGTPAMAIAYGILKRYKHIGIWGIELSVSEYKYQAECIRYWIGFAKGRLGVEHVELHQLNHMGKNLLEAPLYGYEGAFSFTKEYFEERVATLNQQWNEKENEINKVKSKLETTVTEMKFDKVPEISRQYQGLAFQGGELAGALAEAERYVTFGDRYADRGGFETAGALAQKNAEAEKIKMLQITGVVEYVWQGWCQQKTNAATNQFRALLAQMGAQSYETGAQFGMMQENFQYLQKYDSMLLANGVVQ